jgi:hypothetical protein
VKQRILLLLLVFQKQDGGVELMDVAEERQKQWVLVYMIMNIPVLYNGGNFVTS